MTALVIIIYNYGGHFEYGGDGTGSVIIGGESFEGAGITSKAFANYIPFSNVFLTTGKSKYSPTMLGNTIAKIIASENAQIEFILAAAPITINVQKRSLYVKSAALLLPNKYFQDWRP